MWLTGGVREDEIKSMDKSDVSVVYTEDATILTYNNIIIIL